MSQKMIEKQRLKLHRILSSLEGVKKAYFQPPNGAKLVYPCVIYTQQRFDSSYANGNRYLTYPIYELLLIDFDPESSIQKEIMDLKDGCYVSFNRHYTSDNLHHWAYELTFTKLLW